MNNAIIWVKTTFKGLHHWPECPIEEVSFLQSLHRHTFHIKVSIEISHRDREIEFFILQAFIDETIDALYGKMPLRLLGRRSCEDIAYAIRDCVRGKYPGRTLSVEVSEDDEVGAEVFYEKDE
jgi:hypothetical protein